MDTVEMRVSPDGQAVAIRTENAKDSWNAWAIMHRRNGGSWGSRDTVEDWAALIPDPDPAP